MAKEITKDMIKANLNYYLENGGSIDELKIVIRELEREEVPGRKGGRPLGVGNNESQLIDHLNDIKQRLNAKDKRTDIAASLGVSRQTLHTFIVEHLPEFHKTK